MKKNPPLQAATKRVALIAGAVLAALPLAFGDDPVCGDYVWFFDASRLQTWTVCWDTATGSAPTAGEANAAGQSQMWLDIWNSFECPECPPGKSGCAKTVGIDNVDWEEVEPLGAPYTSGSSTCQDYAGKAEVDYHYGCSNCVGSH